MYRILFVEKDIIIILLIKQYKLWQNSKFQIAGTAETGKEALELLEKESFDLVIADIQLPLLDGLGFIRQMRSRGDETPVLLASTYMDFKYAKEGIRLGALDFIEKPYTEEKLSETLEIAEEKITVLARAYENSQELYAFISRKKLEIVSEKLLMLKEESGELLFSLSDKLRAGYPEEPWKVAHLLEMLLNELWKHIIHKFKWVAILEEPGLKIRNEEYQRDFHKGFTELTGIIEKYSLHKQDKQTSRICNILAMHRADPAVTDILEQELGLTKDYISRIFRTKMGIPISQYITMLRMEYAKKQLMNTDDKVYEISEMLGYQTTDYFTRLFKSYSGYSPVQYRKLLYTV